MHAALERRAPRQRLLRSHHFFMDDDPSKASFDAELDWIRADEQPLVDAIQASLAEQLPGWPTDFAANLTHDLHACRFLRGHKHDVEKASAAMLGSVKYRTDLSQQPPVAAMRAAMGEGCTYIDLAAIPNSAEVLRCLPFRTVADGRSVSGLPLAIVPMRLVDPKAFHDMADRVEFFMRCMLEARAIVLHNLSLEQSRMVKFVEIRDFNNVYVSEMITHGRPFIQRLKALISSVQVRPRRLPVCLCWLVLALCWPCAGPSPTLR